MKPETARAIEACARFNGGRSMPRKSWPLILPLLVNLPPDSRILDVGCGRGSAGRIIRAEFGYGRVVHGFDIHAPYLSSVQGYDYFWQGDLLQEYERLAAEEYDPVLFLDVLEHLDRADAIRVIAEFRARGRRIIASIPNAPNHWRQNPDFEKANPHEAHRHDWTDAEIEKMLALAMVGADDGIGVYQHGF